MPDNIVNPPHTRCLRQNVVDILSYRLKHDTITEKRVSQVAQAVLSQLTDNLNTDQIVQTFAKLKTDFPELANEFKAAFSACETIRARETLEQTVIPQVAAGNIDQALATVQQFKVT